MVNSSVSKRTSPWMHVTSVQAEMAGHSSLSVKVETSEPLSLAVVS